MDRDTRWNGFEENDGDECSCGGKTQSGKRRFDFARAMLWARTRRHAPPWPSHDESDRAFRDAWLALEREAADPAMRRDPTRGKSRLDEFLDEPFDDQLEEGISPDKSLRIFDRVVLAAWLRKGDPMARRVLDWVRESVDARRADGPGGSR